MSSFYDYWLKQSKWNSKQAALLFNDKDPRIDKDQIKFPVENDDFSGAKQGTWQWETIEDYFLFETADWEKYRGDWPEDPYFWFHSPKEASPLAFIYVAFDIGIKM